MPWENSPQNVDQLHQTQTWRSLFQQFVAFAAPTGSDLVLELGVETGRLSLLLAAKAREVQGLARSPDWIAAADKTYKVARVENISIETGSFDELPFGDGSFDLVSSCNTLYSVSDPETTMRELGRVTRNGGRIVVVNPSPEMTPKAIEQYIKKNLPARLVADGLQSLAESAARHRRFTEDDLADLFALTGIEEIEIESGLSDLFFMARGRKG
jgi:ubiquinone/menaquinone biosynthesis C-methylase UbiE